MTRFKIKNLKILTCCLFTWLALFGALHLVRCSEFPERECCDLTTTSTIGPLPLPPAASPTDKSQVATSSVQTISVGRSGSNIKVASAILNCILARQLCFEDPSCSAILEIIPRVCGPIPVSCSTVTVTKCQAALRTLQAFQFFRPTCLCKEPGMDPDCNHFRDFLFDHPCGFVLKKAEKDPYPIDALPTCNHALSVCQQERKCLKLFEDFKTHCKVRDNKCKMESRDACHDSWTNLRLSPMFGCICPNNHMKKRCDRIFNIVNHNPCVDRLIFFPSGMLPKFKQKLQQKHHSSSSNNNSSSHSSLTSGNHQSSETLSNNIEDTDETDTDDDDYDDRIRAEIYSNYPHYLHPPSWGLNNPLVLASHSPHTYDDDDVVVEQGGPAGGVEDAAGGAGARRHHHTVSAHLDDLEHSVDDVVVVVDASGNGGHVIKTIVEHVPAAGYEYETQAPAQAPSSAPTHSPGTSETHFKHHKNQKLKSTKTHPKTQFNDEYTTGSDLTHQLYAGDSMDERVRIMGMDEKYHQKIFDENLALIDTPLIATATSTHYTTSSSATSLHSHHGVLTYPFNMSEFQHRHNGHGNESPLDVIDTGNGNGNGNAGLYYQSGQDVEADMSTDIIKQHFQSTCHTALDTCREDPSCLSSLQPMLMHCEMHRCNRIACMNSLQAFYKGPHEDLNLDVAFCLCKKTTNRHDMCMIAQEKLHPVCAQRPPDTSNQQNSNGIYYHPPPACHVVAEMCKEDRECRIKLEFFEQACAVDSVTKKCAGRPSGCRTAMIGILGTSLRTTCACQGTDPQFLYQCVGWRRLLWLNPCVVEAQKDFHMKRLAEMGYLTTTTTTTTSTTTTTVRPTTTTQATTTSTATTTRRQPPILIKQTPKKTPAQVFREFTPKEKSPPTSMEHNYIEQPDSIPLHSGNDENGNSGNDDYHSGDSINKSNKNNNNARKNNAANGSTTSNNEDEKASATNNQNSKNGSNGRQGKNTNKSNNNNNGGSAIIVDFDDQLEHVEHMETTDYIGMTAPNSPTTTTTTTTMMTTTTQAPRNCVVQRPHQSDQLIREGTSKRIYSLDDAECSELCSCGESLTLTCHALCVPFAPCRTALAFYSHASPAYQAFRGRCLCYSGRFICMKPPLGEYTLPGGVFLLLGYSSADEALLRPHTNLGVQDAVRALQQYVTTNIDNQTQCTLSLFNMTDENIIIAARLPHDAKLVGIELLRKEKDECTNVLKTISHHINTEHNELQSHRLLSIFKMSEVEVVWPESSAAFSSNRMISNVATLSTWLRITMTTVSCWLTSVSSHKFWFKLT